jgi:Conjugal transfer protein
VRKRPTEQPRPKLVRGPLHAFDDGRKVYIEFPRGIAQGEMPPLFIIGADGRTLELVNYRVRNDHMIVDRLFAAAELRLGDKGSERRVQPFPTGTLGWLGTTYFASDEFQGLDAQSQRNRRNILESCFAETSISREGRPIGFCPLHLLTARPSRPCAISRRTSLARPTIDVSISLPCLAERSR